MQVLLEIDIEYRVLEWCESVDILDIKLNLLGRRGWPDRLLVCPNGRIIWVEFKRPKKNAEKLQAYVHRKLREHKQLVYIARDINNTISFIKTAMESEGVPETSNNHDASASLCRLVSGSGLRQD